MLQLPSTFPISQATVVTINISNITSHCRRCCQPHLGLSCVTTCRHQQEHQGDSQMFCAALLCGDYLLSLTEAAISIIFVATKVLSKQTCVCHDNASFVSTKVCLPRQNFCHDKNVFVMTKYFCHHKSFCHDTFVTTKVLSRQQDVLL